METAVGFLLPPNVTFFGCTGPMGGRRQGGVRDAQETAGQWARCPALMPTGRPLVIHSISNLEATSAHCVPVAFFVSKKFNGAALGAAINKQ